MIRSAFISVISFFLFSVFSIAQTPQTLSYQAVVRDVSGNIIAGSTVGMRFSILQGSETGTAVCVEEFSPVTNDYGLVTIKIGSVNTTDFQAIDWSAGPYFVKVEVDEAGGTSWVETGTSQLLSVPYALYADHASGLSGTDIWKNNGSDTYYDSGNVGIGTNSPAARLSVDGDVYINHDATQNEINKIGFTGNRGSVGFDGTLGVESTFLAGGTGKGIVFRTAGDERMRITKTGLIGIGNDNPSSRFEVNAGAGYADEDPLFEVKNSEGTPVFAVYNNGVRVLIEDDPLKKGPKGGFAIGGFDPTKAGSTVDFMRISPDSIRFYIDNEANSKGPKGGFAIGGFDRTKTTIQSFFDVSSDTSDIINPSENRVLWYPVKNAFLAGKVLIEDPDSVGTNSVATGFESKSIGSYSQAMGYRAIARNNYSTAMGIGSVAGGDYSAAIGRNSVTSDQSSFAFGEVAQATGYKSYALGYLCIASGIKSYCLGSQNRATGETSYAIGHAARSNGNSSMAIGRNSRAEAYHSIAIGVSDDADIYKMTSASGNKSVAIGTNNDSRQFASYTYGYSLDNNDSYSVVLGSYNEPVNDGTALIVGNGYVSFPDTVRSNAMVVYDDGNVTIKGTLTENSDGRLKKDIRDIGKVGDKIMKLKPVYYNFIENKAYPAGQNVGLIAQEVQNIFPEFVVESSDGILSVNYSKLSVMLVKSFQEQQTEIEDLRSQVDILKQMVMQISASE